MAEADPDRVSLLLDTYLFEDLSPAQVEPLARAALLRRVVRGEYVWHVGDTADALCVVASGQLKDSLVTEDGDELVHSYFGAGMVIGEPGFFAAERNRVMAVVAVEPSTLLMLERERLIPFIQRHPRVIARALEGLASVARGQTELITALARRPLQERLLLRLLDLAETNAPAVGAASVTPKISRATLAAMVGASRENVNRALATLAAEGAIRIERGRYLITDPKRSRAGVSLGWPLLTRSNRRRGESAPPGA
jgi:CRP/FNR family cyclic AMP-dependent transcriptional regulator